MLGYDKYYSLYTLSDYKENISNISNSCSYTDNSAITTNQYTYLVNEECLYLKKDTSKRGFIQFNLDNVRKGDEVYIYFEYYNLTKNKVEVSLTNSVIGSLNFAEKFDTTKEANTWATYESKLIYPFEDVSKCHINIGLWTHLTGEYKLRNVKIIHKAQTKPIGLQIKTYMIKKDSEGWIIRDDFSNSGGLIERYQDRLILHFNPTFNSVKRPVASVGMDMYEASKDYIVRVSGVTTSQANIFFYKVSDGSLITDPTTIPTDVCANLTFIVI